MVIDEDDIIQPKYCKENKALACLLAADVVFMNNINTAKPDEPKEYSIVIYVIANDIFAWGGSDAECIRCDWDNPESELMQLYKLWKENSSLGPVKWLCLKRNEQPQAPVKEMMIKDNYWDDVLENLPENYYDNYHKNKG